MPPRKQQMQTERRRRSDSITGKRTKLRLDMGKLDTDNFEYRWIKNSPERLAELIQYDDWNLVQDRDNVTKTDDTGMGSDISVHAGTGETGAPERLILAKKRKDFQDEDRAKRARSIDELEAGLKQGDAPSAEAASGDSFYQPRSGGIKIER